MSRVRILGIGSPSGDDQVGWLAVDALLARGAGRSDGVAIDKLDRPGATLVALLQNVERAILIDAMQCGGEPGAIRRFDQQDWPGYRQGLSSHGLGVLDALLLARELGSLPPRLDLYGIEIATARPGDEARGEIRAAAAQLAEQIVAELATESNPHA